MKQFLKFIFAPILVLCFLLLASCGILDKKAQQRKTREGLESISSQELPELDGFDLVKVVSLDLSSSDYGKTCSYARDYLIIGTSLPESDALERYVEALLRLGWTREGDQYPTSNNLIHGKNARIVVRYGDPGADVRDAADYDQLRDNYQSVIFVRVDYILPERDGC